METGTNYEFLYTILEFILAALMAGGLTYFFMKRQAKKANQSLLDLQKSYSDLLKDGQKKEKLAQLEINARDKKLAILNAKLDEVKGKE
jgi:uncharacterized protein HemX